MLELIVFLLTMMATSLLAFYMAYSRKVFEKISNEIGEDKARKKQARFKYGGVGAIVLAILYLSLYWLF